MSHFIAFNLRCPVCALLFQADELHAAHPVALETDFRPVYEGADPIFSRVHSCPGCRYSAYRHGFASDAADDDELPDEPADDPRSLEPPARGTPDDAALERLRRHVRAGDLVRGLLAPDREPFGALRYLLAARSLELAAGEETPAAAHHVLRAAWCARLERERGAESSILRDFVGRIVPLADREATPEAERVRLTYLAAECARRAGDFGLAAELFARLEREVDPDEDEAQFFVSLARRQNMLALVKSDVVARIPADYTGRREYGEEDESGPGPGDVDDDGGSVQ